MDHDHGARREPQREGNHAAIISAHGDQGVVFPHCINELPRGIAAQYLKKRVAGSNLNLSRAVRSPRMWSDRISSCFGASGVGCAA